MPHWPFHVAVLAGLAAIVALLFLL